MKERMMQLDEALLGSGNLRCIAPNRLYKKLSVAGIRTASLRWQGVQLTLLHSPCPTGVPVLLLHGVTYSAASVFDLAVPGYERADFSTLLQLTWRGLDTWALDFAGYGLSGPRPYPDTETINDYVAQVRAASIEIEARTGVLPVLVGWSWGAQVASRFAGHYPKSCPGLVFWSGLWGGSGMINYMREVRFPKEVRRRNTPTHAAADFRTPVAYAPEVRTAFISHALSLDPTSPTTGLRETVLNMPLHNPVNITCPVLAIHGELDPVVQIDDITDYVAALASPHKWHIRLPGADHNAQFGHDRNRLFDAIADFCITHGYKHAAILPQDAI
ncbi:alpha/beta hydrolase [Halomonas eurihalina]|nr:alpha/beta hydrolase [Halomonas eurihalina]